MFNPSHAYRLPFTLVYIETALVVLPASHTVLGSVIIAI